MFMAKIFTAQEPGTVEYKIWKTYNGILFRDKNETSCQAMKGHGGAVNAHY